MTDDTTYLKVWCKLNKSFNLTEKNDRTVGFAGASPTDQSQRWIKTFFPEKKDGDDHQAFTLANACSGSVMKYIENNKAVQLVKYAAGDDAQLWTSVNSVDGAYATVRPFTHIEQNLTADTSQNIDENTKVVVSTKTGADNQLWKIEPWP